MSIPTAPVDISADNVGFDIFTLVVFCSSVMKKNASYLAELVVVIALFKALKMIQHRLIDDLIMSYRQVEESNLYILFDFYLYQG